MYFQVHNDNVLVMDPAGIITLPAIPEGGEPQLFTIAAPVEQSVGSVVAPSASGDNSNKYSQIFGNSSFTNCNFNFN